MSRGVTLPLPGVTLVEQAPWVRRCEALGYSGLYSQEVGGLDAFAPLLTAAPVSGQLQLGTAIAGVFQRGPALLAMQAAALAEAAPGRAQVGIGASSPRIVEDWNGLAYREPVARVRAALRFLRRALAGERIREPFLGPGRGGFRLERPPPAAPALLVAALRERMLSLAGAEADGVVLSLLTPQDVPAVLEVARAARGAGAPALRVVLRVGVVRASSEARALRAARRQLAAYLAASPYADFHAWRGRGELVASLRDAWRRGGRDAAEATVPEELARACLALGSPEECRARLAAFEAAGVDTVVVAPMGPAAGDDLESWLEALAS